MADDFDERAAAEQREYQLEKRNRWIHVGERLPDDDITVLIALEDSDEPVWIGFHDEDGWHSATSGEPLRDLVTHWQPMIEGPKR